MRLPHGIFTLLVLFFSVEEPLSWPQHINFANLSDIIVKGRLPYFHINKFLTQLHNISRMVPHRHEQVILDVILVELVKVDLEHGCVLTWGNYCLGKEIVQRCQVVGDG
jgi:hypothetical protein